MKFRHISFMMAGLLSFGAMAQDKTPATNTPAVASPTNAPPAAAKPAEPPDKGQLSYAVGVYYANYLTNDLMRQLGLEPKLDLDVQGLLAAYTNVITGIPTTMNTQEAIKILQQQSAYQRERIQEEVKKLTATGPENKAKGEKFMDDMAKTPGVTKLASGVIYKVIKEGEGEKPGTNDMATLSFRATLIDGTEVVSAEHKVMSLSPGSLPPGLSEAVTLMTVGSHWMVYLPYPQAFGERPGIQDPKHGYKVGPYSVLIFDVSVESVQHRPAPPTGPGQGMRSGGPMTMPPGTAVTAPGATVPPPVTSSSIVRVPSAEEMTKGEKPRAMTDAEIEAAKKATQTNAPSPK